MSNIDGIWDCMVTTPMGKEPNELTLHAAPDGSFTGTMKNLKDGQILEMQQGRFDGKLMSWTINLVKPFKVTVKCEVQVEGQSFSGHGSAIMGKIPMTGVKRA